MDKNSMNVMDAAWVPATDEDLERRHRALVYSTKVALKRRQWEKKVDRFSKRMLTASVVLWAFTMALAIWARWLL